MSAYSSLTDDRIIMVSPRPPPAKGAASVQRYASVIGKPVPGGVVHKLPVDLRTALSAHPTAIAAWRDITPLARNEFICWVEDAKQE
ncbi:MAG: YdeI/OmpD-associated family protein, partial [Myxococcales bacterium]